MLQKIQSKIVLVLVFVICTSCSSLSTFGEIKTISIKQYKEQGPLKNWSLERSEDRVIEYVKNGTDSCYQNQNFEGDVFTVKVSDLEDFIYLQKVSMEKWSFEVDESAVGNLRKGEYSRIKVVPIHPQISYEVVTCEIKFGGFFRFDYGYRGVNNYASFRILQPPKRTEVNN